jgi:hypothetical protein
MLADLKLGETITYTIKYPSSGLTSKATYDFESRAILKEVFPDKWYVEFQYNDSARRTRRIPDIIRIMTCADNETRGSLINEYRFVEATPQGLLYKDSSSGGQKRVDHEYIAFPSGSR